MNALNVPLMDLVRPRRPEPRVINLTDQQQRRRLAMEASERAQQRYLEGGDKDASWWAALDDELELISRAAMRTGVESL